VPQGDTEAAKWFRKAADQGHAAAQNNLGWMYQNGRGVPQGHSEAVKWYHKAAAQGHAAARAKVKALQEKLQLQDKLQKKPWSYGRPIAN
jgi:TPR repeat protein